MTIINLGCIGDLDWSLPKAIKAVTTLVELDAVGSSRNTSTAYERHIKLSQKVIAPEPGKRKFRENQFVGSSSILEPIDELVADFGVERYYSLKQYHTVECQTVAQIREEHAIDSIAFFKTDLEGIDLPLLKSCESFIDRVGLIQSELRFKPMYIGEPYLHEAFDWLQQKGFELISLDVEYWKYNTPRRFWQKRGNASFADCLFRKVSVPPEMLVQQIIVLKMLGYENTAEHLFLKNRDKLSSAFATEDIEAVLRFRHKPLRNILHDIRMFLYPIEMKLKQAIGRCSHYARR